MVKRILDFIVYSNFFIAACALLFTYETFCLLHLPASLNWYLLLIFLCTIFVYSLHYFVKSTKEKNDTRLVWCRANRKLLQLIILASFLLIAAGVLYHFKSIFITEEGFDYRNLAWFIIIPLLSLAYSHPLNPWNKKSLRQIGWLKMGSLSFIWSFTTVILPVLMQHDSINGLLPNKYALVLFINRFVFIASLSLLFNINDYEEDKLDNIKTLAVVLGPGKSILYGKWLMLLMNAAAAFFLLHYFELNNPLFYAALLLPVIIVFLLYHQFSPMKDETTFIIRYDGMMIVKALLLIFALLIYSK
ncbi:MAG: hypothetical protein WAT14_00540 [Chitinophagaceae bacterium]